MRSESRPIVTLAGLSCTPAPLLGGGPLSLVDAEPLQICCTSSCPPGGAGALAFKVGQIGSVRKLHSPCPHSGWCREYLAERELWDQTQPGNEFGLVAYIFAFSEKAFQKLSLFSRKIFALLRTTCHICSRRKPDNIRDLSAWMLECRRDKADIESLEAWNL